MTAIDQFRYDGKRVLVVGGATGMGAAAAQTAAELGAEVVAMDYAPITREVAQTVSVDLADRASIDTALEQVDGPIHAIFSAAGVADGPKLMRINFIGHRHLIETLLDDGRLPRGSAVCFISSVGGIGWESDLPRLQEFLATPDYESADAWVKAHEPEGIIHYGFSKQAINAYVATKAYPFMAKGVRINAICPGPTDTPLARANADLWLTFAQDYRDATGCEIHTPQQMANAMVFLNSDAACGISGVTLLVDNGHVMSSLTGSYAPGKPIIDLIMGRVSLT
ncbi:short-chain dehydrogenase [Mycobacterium heckeshornense]|uniref:3-alpha-hydroxysteroid dehydrogenase n=1 Tax=Mycobacterium heckeshornense TaxID=110505 RepID=A0A2G8B5X0_9MYCO|nr:SDR family oxidoreductase [Mycobacterium heckeshornense]KMV22757.1 short-chain dehydrogenase [Mycobacterium heckeshornense]MCV7033980.1 SDR family oxidoreductase [Mycobacterium heckeshornense]PIJ33124.1 short-chain dehydrogenase [Mycobacterium heckeshornense]BCO37212.1 3-alpha-hydroxysteroid dehydrogenase [Mycobacterium heckeshornense]